MAGSPAGPALAAVGGVFPELHWTLGGTHLIVSLHALTVLLGVAAAAVLVCRRMPGGLPMLVVAAPVSLFGARALAGAVSGGPGGLWSGALSSTGGIAAGMLVICLLARLARRSALALLDALVPAGLLGLAVGRIGCFLAGCCYGAPTALPWGVVFPALGPPARHPVQLYSALGDLGLLLLIPGHGAPVGRVTRAAALGYGLLRAALELVRDPAATDHIPGTAVSLPQAMALVLAAGALAAPHVGSGLRRWRASTMPPPRRRALHGG